MFQIIEFTASKTVAVIPSNWITQPGICLWPPIKGSSVDKLVKKRENPGKNWQEYTVRSLGSFCTYHQARAHLQRSEMTSDLQSEAEYGERASRKKVPSRYISDDSDEDDNSQSLLPSAPLLPKHLNLRLNTFKHNSISTPTVLPPVSSTPAIPPFDQTPTRQHTFYSAPLQQQALTSPHLYHNTQSSLNTQFLEQPFPSEMKESCSCNKLQTQILQALKNEVESHTKVLQHHTEVLEKHSRVLMKFLHHQKVTETDRADVSNAVENSSPVLLPVASIEDLEALESHLQENKENFSRMVTYFASFGGQGTKRIFQRLMQELLKHELSLQLNWMGRGRKHPFNRYTHIHGVIYRAVKCNASETLTLNDVEKFIKDWLRFSSDRCGGRRSRKAAKVPNEQE